MVSKAADGSSNTTMEILPSSILVSRSLVTRVRAVSVLCLVDMLTEKGCRGRSISGDLEVGKEVFSNSLNKNGRLDIGL